MLIYIGADHRGFALKEHLKIFLRESGFSVTDLGNAALDENDDYPDFAAEVGRRVSQEFETARGVVICASGVGVDIVVNKFMRIRSVLAATPDQAYDSRNDDDTNVLALGADYLDLPAAKRILITWLETPFANEPRFRRRIEKISQLEQKMYGASAKEEDKGHERSDRGADEEKGSPREGLHW